MMELLDALRGAALESHALITIRGGRIRITNPRLSRTEGCESPGLKSRGEVDDGA